MKLHPLARRIPRHMSERGNKKTKGLDENPHTKGAGGWNERGPILERVRKSLSWRRFVAWKNKQRLLSKGFFPGYGAHILWARGEYRCVIVVYGSILVQKVNIGNKLNWGLRPREKRVLRGSKLSILSFPLPFREK